MNPINAYKFCLKCSGALIKSKKNLLTCQKCGFEFYINPSPCNAVIIENENKEIMLVERKIDPMKGHWDLPGGFINSYETLEDSVKREIKEELGIEIKIKEIVGVYIDNYNFQNINNPVLVIVVSAVIIRGEIKVSDDVSEFKYFPKTEVLKQKIAFSCIEKSLKDYLSLKNL